MAGSLFKYVESRVRGPMFLCSDCSAVHETVFKNQMGVVWTDLVVISHLIVEWVIYYKLFFIAS